MTDASLQPILALLGTPVAGNPTQYALEKAFAAQQLDYRFLTLEVSPEDLGDAVRGMRAMGFLGGECTRPHKSAVLAHLHRATETAALAGAANCIYREGAELVGDNTEGRAVVEAIGRLTDVEGKHVVLFGAGATARAIAAELARARAAAITILARSGERAAEFVELLAGKTAIAASRAEWASPYQPPADTNILVNASAAGRDDHPLPLAPGALQAEWIVVDVAVNPPRTRLLDEAAARGCKTIDGLEIFIRHTALSMQRWSGVRPDDNLLREAVEEFLLL